MMKKTLAFAALAALLALVAPAEAQDDPAAVEMAKHKAAIAASETQRSDQQAALKAQYAAALGRLKERLDPGSDVQALLAIAAELESLDGGEPANAGKPDEALLSARATYRTQLGRIGAAADERRVAATASAIESLRKLTGALAAADELDAALAAERQRKILEADAEFLAAKTRLAAAPPDDSGTSSGDPGMAVPRHRLHAYFPFDGRLEPAAGEGKLALQGDRRYAAGRSGRSLHLDNPWHGPKGSWLEFELPGGGVGEFSISFCARITQGAHGTRPLFSIGKPDDGAKFYIEHQHRGEDAAHMTYLLGGGEHRDASARPPIPEPRWSHIAITFDTEKIVYYVNGRAAMELEQPRQGFNFSGLIGAIGTRRYYRNNGEGQRILTPMRGPDMLVDELAIYSRALNAGEVRAMAKNYRLLDEG